MASIINLLLNRYHLHFCEQCIFIFFVFPEPQTHSSNAKLISQFCSFSKSRWLTCKWTVLLLPGISRLLISKCTSPICCFRPISQAPQPVTPSAPSPLPGMATADNLFYVSPAKLSPSTVYTCHFVAWHIYLLLKCGLLRLQSDPKHSGLIEAVPSNEFTNKWEGRQYSKFSTVPGEIKVPCWLCLENSLVTYFQLAGTQGTWFNINSNLSKKTPKKQYILSNTTDSKTKHII